MGSKINKKIPKILVEEMWQYVGNFENMRESVYEIIACREMIVEDDFLFFPQWKTWKLGRLNIHLIWRGNLSRKES